ncbi:glycoside hydrolase [Collybia nuda]|uniref:non-reducing end alpha-L-arabinofuranosidase n=1 Tax=Collybia nuda TaxID=64659 RepID=A0A9P6CKK8_9AGAR|nr:glycoside hydrolase [Collybia nuda]
MFILTKNPGLLLLIAVLLPVARSVLEAPNALELRLTKNLSHAIPPTLYGYMWEVCKLTYGDGGLYAELLQNRAFQAVIPGTLNALNAWQPYNGARLSVTSKTKGVSNALRNSLEVKFPKFVEGPIGFENTGYWGIKVQEDWKYKGSFWAKSESFSGTITVSLKSTCGTVFTKKDTNGISKEWKKFTFEFQPSKSATDDNNVFSVVVDGKAAAGKTIYFGMFSLFPPTFRGRENGMRIDLAEALDATQPSLWRFPGGNNLEGMSFDTRWKWNETIGPLEDRPGRVGDWGYSNTDGLGLMEYLNWAEDLDAVRIWAGISIANYSDLSTWPVVPKADLQPYIEDGLNLIEFVTGDAKSSKWGQMRARLGRTEPYALKFVEIGNEDWVCMIASFCYAAYRWKAFVSAISQKYPHLEFIATTFPETALDPPYDSPSWFTKNAFMFDDYPRNGTQFFVVTSTNDLNALPDIPNGRLAYPTLEGAAAEAAFMTGLERNSDVVFASACGYFFQHIRNYQWTPDIVTYDASRLTKSTSYYVQQMFSVNRGTHVLQTLPASTADAAPLFWVASYNNETDAVFIKVSNTGLKDLVANFFLDFPITGFGTATSISSPTLSPISGIFNISNTMDEPEQIIPVASSFALPHPDRFNYTFPATSVTVISLQSPNLGAS